MDIHDTMSRNTALYVKICEAKNLPIKDVTCTVWRSLNPFWGEEYSLHLPNGFHQMSLYIYDEDRLNRDDFIGRVTFLKQQMCSASGKGVCGWFELRESNKDEEIQGELHMEISKTVCDGKVYLKVKVIEARELAPKDSRGTSDPFVRISFQGTTLQTQKIKASRFPKWHELLEFDAPVSAAQESELHISVWDWDRIGGDDFMGQVVLRVSDIKEGHNFNQWFTLLPSLEHCKKLDGKHRGSIRVTARLTEERILPTEYYKPLLQLLNESLSSEKHDIRGPTPLMMLREVSSLDLLALSSSLVKLFLSQGNIVTYLDLVCTEEIESTAYPNTLFRGNSLATKSVDQFMKIVGIPFILEILGPIIKLIYEENKLVELDPFKLSLMRKVRRPSLKVTVSDEDLIGASKDILLRYLNLIHENFVNAVHKVPSVMRVVFKTIQRRIVEKWPQEDYKDHKYLGVSGFLYLRFLVPAILGPKLFFLKDQHPSARVSRTLTLIAKTIQCVGNLGLQIGLGKEQYLEPLYPFIRASVKGIRGHLDDLCNIDESKVKVDYTRRRSVFHPSVVVKQGNLYKKRWCETKQFRSITFSKRYFWLKYDSISYAAKPTDHVRTTIIMHQIIAVEFVDKSAFGKTNLGQIITRNSRGSLEIVYFRAKDVNECYSWVSSLRKMVLVNSETLDYFHPGAYRHSKWTCCLQTEKQDEGCSKTHTHAVLGDWRDPLDPDVEAQTLYTQLYRGRHKLKQKYVKFNEEIRKSLLSLNYLPPGSNLDIAEQQRRHSHCCSRENIRGLLNLSTAEIQQLKDHRRGSLSNPTLVRVKSKRRRGSFSDPDVYKIHLNNNGYTQHNACPDIQINIELVSSDKTTRRDSNPNAERRSKSRRKSSEISRSPRNSLTGGGAMVGLSKSFNQNDHISPRPEKEMVTLFKARSHSDIQDAIIPGVKDALKNDHAYQKQSAVSLFRSQLPTAAANTTRVTFRSSRESMQSCSRNGFASLLSIPLPMGRSPGDCDAELSSLAQLLDAVGDLERVHAVYSKMEMERKRDTLHNILDSSFSDLLNTSI